MLPIGLLAGLTRQNFMCWFIFRTMFVDSDQRYYMRQKLLKLAMLLSGLIACIVIDRLHHETSRARSHKATASGTSLVAVSSSTHLRRSHQELHRARMKKRGRRGDRYSHLTAPTGRQLVKDHAAWFGVGARSRDTSVFTRQAVDPPLLVCAATVSAAPWWAGIN